MRILWLTLLPLSVWAQTYGLTSLIDHAGKSNPAIEATRLQSKGKMMEVEAAKSAFWPTLDIGASYTRNTPNALTSPGEISNGYINAAVDLYDGGRKQALLNAKRHLQTASLFEQEAFSKSVTLKIIDGYYTAYKLQAMLAALYGQSKELKAQLERIRRFNAAGLATQEDIDKLVAVYENNNYLIESMKLQLETTYENLRLESGLDVSALAQNTIVEPGKTVFEPYEKTKILKANADAMGENAKAAAAGYLPQVALQNTYNRTDYDKLYSAPGFDTGSMLLDHQNKTMLTMNMRVFDNGKMDKEREALKYQKLALESQQAYARQEQEMQFRLAGKNLSTNRAKLKSAGSELKAAQSAYRSVVQKFENGLVDNVAYLDALNNQTLAKAQYDETRYDYEIAKSIYYYYAGKDPREYVQ